MVPQNLQYTAEHEWVKVEGGEVTVGITGHAQEQLGDMVFVELPEVGKVFEPNGEMVGLESAKAAASVYAPCKGKISAVNESLADAPGKVNDDPYGEGWMVKLTVEDDAALGKLKSPEEYETYLKEEGG
jgi:glycine cleavage system H protein